MSIKENLKKITLLRYAFHLPKDLITIISYKKKMYHLKHNAVKKGEDLAVFKDAYKGKRCFIIGLGPSLTINDLNMLKGEICFSSNRIFQFFDRTDWRPTFFCSGDPRFSVNVGENLYKVVDEVKYVILNLAHLMNYDARVRLRDNVFFYQTIIGTGFDSINKERGKYPQKLDLTKELDSIGTITYEIMEMALYMGFTEIFLLGIDHFYSGGEENYSNGMKPLTADDRSRMNLVISTKRWTEGYEYIRDISNKKGISIKNATRGGHLEVFERVDLDELMKGKE
jgi:hypothetical protein